VKILAKLDIATGLTFSAALSRPLPGSEYTGPV
jgi:hypothetical protein